ncbi:MAG: hypothetical protein PHS02_01110 [Candidatus ainarchaeum sp.]|nr:hypothetical protein [Candidatus ainarchaeum sp.]
MPPLSKSTTVDSNETGGIGTITESKGEGCYALVVNCTRVQSKVSQPAYFCVDRTPPTITQGQRYQIKGRVYNPDDGEVVNSSTFVLNMSASDNKKYTFIASCRVELWNGTGPEKFMGNLSFAPTTSGRSQYCEISVKLANGTYRYRVFALDSAENYAGTLYRTVVVNGNPTGCDDCENVNSFDPSTILLTQQSGLYDIKAMLYFDNTSSGVRQPVPGAPLLVWIRSSTYSYLTKVVTDENGVAHFDYSGWREAPHEYSFLYCCFYEDCGFEFCINASGVDDAYREANGIYSVDTVPTMPNQPEISMDKHYLLPSVKKIDISPDKQDLYTQLQQTLCVPIFILFGLLMGALYYTGRNPFGFIDLSPLRVGRHIKYSPRGMQTGFKLSTQTLQGVASRVGTTAVSAKGGFKGFVKQTLKQETAPFRNLKNLVAPGKDAKNVGLATRLTMTLFGGDISAKGAAKRANAAQPAKPPDRRGSDTGRSTSAQPAKGSTPNKSSSTSSTPAVKVASAGSDKSPPTKEQSAASPKSTDAAAQNKTPKPAETASPKAGTAMRLITDNALSRMLGINMAGGGGWIGALGFFGMRWAAVASLANLSYNAFSSTTEKKTVASGKEDEVKAELKPRFSKEELKKFATLTKNGQSTTISDGKKTYVASLELRTENGKEVRYITVKEAVKPSRQIFSFVAALTGVFHLLDIKTGMQAAALARRSEAMANEEQNEFKKEKSRSPPRGPLAVLDELKEKSNPAVAELAEKMIRQKIYMEGISAGRGFLASLSTSAIGFLIGTPAATPIAKRFIYDESMSVERAMHIIQDDVDKKVRDEKKKIIIINDVPERGLYVGMVNPDFIEDLKHRLDSPDQGKAMRQFFKERGITYEGRFFQALEVITKGMGAELPALAQRVNLAYMNNQVPQDNPQFQPRLAAIAVSLDSSKVSQDLKKAVKDISAENISKPEQLGLKNKYETELAAVLLEISKLSSLTPAQAAFYQDRLQDALRKTGLSRNEPLLALGKELEGIAASFSNMAPKELSMKAFESMVGGIFKKNERQVSNLNFEAVMKDIATYYTEAAALLSDVKDPKQVVDSLKQANSSPELANAISSELANVLNDIASGRISTQEKLKPSLGLLKNEDEQQLAKALLRAVQAVQSKDPATVESSRTDFVDAVVKLKIRQSETFSRIDSATGVSEEDKNFMKSAVLAMRHYSEREPDFTQENIKLVESGAVGGGEVRRETLKYDHYVDAYGQLNTIASEYFASETRRAMDKFIEDHEKDRVLQEADRAIEQGTQPKLVYGTDVSSYPTKSYDNTGKRSENAAAISISAKGLVSITENGTTHKFDSANEKDLYMLAANEKDLYMLAHAYLSPQLQQEGIFAEPPQNVLAKEVSMMKSEPNYIRHIIDDMLPSHGYSVTVPAIGSNTGGEVVFSKGGATITVNNKPVKISTWEDIFKLNEGYKTVFSAAVHTCIEGRIPTKEDLEADKTSKDPKSDYYEDFARNPKDFYKMAQHYVNYALTPSESKSASHAKPKAPQPPFSVSAARDAINDSRYESFEYNLLNRAKFELEIANIKPLGKGQ